MNAWQNVDWIAEESLMHMEDQLVIAQLTSRDKTADFNAKPNGYAVGSQVSIKMRGDYEARDFEADGGEIVTQGVKSSTRMMEIEKWLDVSVKLTAKEKRLNMDSFAEEVVIPAIYRLSEKVDIYVGTKILQAAGMYASDNLFGSAADMAQARKTATLQQLDPASRWALVDLDLEAQLLGADWFNKHDERGQTGEGVRNNAELARTLGMRFFTSINFPSAAAFTAGGFAGLTNHPSTLDAAVTPAQSQTAGGNNAIGTSVLAFDGATGTVNAGDRIQIAGVRRPLKVATTTTGASGDIPLADPITEVIPDNAAITVVGSGQSLLHHGVIMDNQSMAVAMPVLDLPSDKPAQIANNNGFSIRVVSGYDMKHKCDIMSLDLLVGAAAFDPRRMTLLSEY